MKSGSKILTTKKFLLMFIVGLVTLFVQAVWADAAVPDLSGSICIRTYPLSTNNDTYVYTTNALTTRGTASPRRVYNAVVYASDEIYIYSINNTSAYISYPTSSGRKYGYIPSSAVTANNYSQDARTSRAKITTYKRAGGTVYGSISNGDTVYTVAQSGNYTQVIYPVGSNYKMGWIATNSYQSYINASSGNNPQGYLDSVTSDTNNTISVNGWAFDKDNLGSSLTIYIYVGGSMGSSAARYSVTANAHRSDVDNAFPGAGTNHGFSSVINVSQTGTQTIYAYAANIGSGTDTFIGSATVNIKGGSQNNNQPRSTVVSYMNNMASITWTPSTSFRHWSYGKKDGNNHVWSAGTTYYGIPYSQSSRNTTLESFQSKLSGMRYVGPAGQGTYMGNDCSSAVSFAYKKVNAGFPVTNTTGLYPVRGNTKKIGGYNDYGSTSSTYICNKNGSSVIKKSYQSLQAGDLLLTDSNTAHVMMVTGTGNNYVTVTHQTIYKSSLHSTWRINEKWSFDSLYNSKYIPVTMAAW